MSAADRHWGRPDPSVAETRVAVRRALAEMVEHTPGTTEPGTTEPGSGSPLVLVALSGGADSLALAAALAFEAPRAGVRAGAVVVDHGLQAGSADVAEHAAGQARALGLDPALVCSVEVAAGHPDGPEAAARIARYGVLEVACAELGAAAVFTAHTRDDQAEQVLLALARGSGTRAVAGIPPMRGAILRPFLGITRAQTEAACTAQAIEPWHDPHNADPTYTRVRVRDRILPMLEQELGPGIAANLARSAELAREDADALDAMVEEMIEDLVSPAEAGIAVSVAALAANPAALRNRIIRAVAVAEFGAHLSREHTRSIAALATDWHGQGPIDAPGFQVRRVAGELVFSARRESQDPPPRKH